MAKDWFGNGQSISLLGKFEFIQQTEYDTTGVELLLDGLDGQAGMYHIHMVKLNKNKSKN